MQIRYCWNADDECKIQKEVSIRIKEISCRNSLNGVEYGSRVIKENSCTLNGILIYKSFVFIIHLVCEIQHRV